jgi:uncharacterized delta-60 repeat protein
MDLSNRYIKKIALNKSLGILLLCFVLSKLSIGQPGALDPTFNPPSVLFTQGFMTGFGSADSYDSIKSVLQPDGKIIIAGTINNYNGVIVNSTLIRINENGSVDPTFNAGTGIGGSNKYFQDIVLQPDGKIIIGGRFSSYNGTPRNCIARLNADGSLDNSFDPGTGFTFSNSSIQSYLAVNSILIKNDGKIFIAGAFSHYNAVLRKGLAQLNTDGSLDNSFNPAELIYTFPPEAGLVYQIHGAALQSDGKILVGGFDNGPPQQLIRLNSDGTLDNSFTAAGTPGSTNVFRRMAVQPDDKFIVLGNFAYITTGSVVRFNADGTVDNSFGIGSATGTFGFSDNIHIIKFEADDKIIFTGSFTSYTDGSTTVATPAKAIRLLTNGNIDPGFNVPLNPSSVSFIEIQSDQKLMIGYRVISSNGSIADSFLIKRVNADGSLDNVAGTTGGFLKPVASTAIQSDGKIIIGGSFTSYNGIARNHIARINTDGSLDESFNPGSVITNVNAFGVRAIAIQADGKILAGGDYLVRINTDGSIDNSFAPALPPFTVNALAIQSDGKILAGLENGLYRLNTDGSLDAGFVLAIINGVNAIALQPDGKIITAGYLLNRVNADGSLDNSFDASNTSGYFFGIQAMALQTDGKIIEAGPGGGAPRRHNTDGSLDVSFSSPDLQLFQGSYSILLQTDGKILIGGQGGTGSASVKGIDRLNADGSLDATFNAGTGLDYNNGFGVVYSISAQSDGKIIIGGIFQKYNGTTVNNLARVLTACIAPTIPTISATSTNITFPQSTTLSIATGDLNNATNWKWYSNSCGGTLVGTGNSITVSPNRTTTYYLRGEGGCVTPGACVSITITVQAGRYYIHYDNSYGTADNQAAMNSVFGNGNWTDAHFVTDPSSIFTSTTSFVMMDSWFASLDSLGTYLSTNNSLIENWVLNGGRLFINSSGNASLNDINCGFSNTLIKFGVNSITAVAANINDTIFKGPNTPVTTSYNGNLASHSFIIGSGLDTLVKGDNGKLSLAFKQWGNGFAFFGGFTAPTATWTPQPQAINFWYNLFDYVNSVSPVPQYILIGQLSTTSLCSGSNFSVPYTASGFTAGNIFTAQLSDATGSFANPVTIGTINSNASGTINATIPANTLAGTGYRIRIKASQPNNTSADNGLDLTITAPVTPSVSIALTNGNIPDCSGQPLTFTSTPVNGGSNPIYQWKLNGNTNIGTNSPVFIYSNFANGDVLTCTITSNSSCIAQATAVSNGIIPVPVSGIAPSVNIAITSGNNPDCSGDPITFMATPVNGGSSPTYQWFVNGNPVGTNTNTHTVTSPSNNDAVSCIMTSSLSCANPTTAASNAIIIKVSVTPYVIVGYTTGSSTCAGGTLQFYAVLFNGGDNPTYQWKLNGNDVAGATSNLYTQTGFTAGDLISVTMTSSEPCATPAVVTSEPAPISIYSVSNATLSIGSYTNDYCAGATIQFYAAPQNAGTNPGYQWTKNGSPVGNDSYYQDNTLITGDVISCSITTDPACETPITIQSSNSITVTITQPVTPTITIAAGNAVSSSANIFTANITNGGLNPAYEWKKNDVAVGSNSNTYIDLSLVIGDVITCTLNSDAPCATISIVTSNSITVQPLSWCVPIPVIDVDPCRNSWITNVVLGTTVNRASGCNGFYADYTLTDTVKTTSGQTIDFTITEGSDGTNYVENASIYIDYNSDGDFEDAGERVADYENMSLNTNATGTFTVPALLAPGSYRLRVISDNIVSSSCVTNAGEAEDYILQITQPDYCIPIISNPCDMWISNVTIGSINNSSIQPVTCDAGGYTNYSSVLSTTAAPGQPVNYSLSAHGNYYQYADIYVDYNSDGDFDDEGEHAATDIFMDYSGTLVTGSFVVPSLQPHGLYRLRIKSHSTQESQTGPCGNNTNGETEDYTLIVTCIPNGSDIVVKGNDVIINDGDNTVSTANFTSFGNVELTTTMTRTFTIENPGTGPLHISGVTITGFYFYYTIINQPALSVAAGESTSFTVQFSSPTFPTIHNAVIHINTDLCSEQDFDFAIQAISTCPLNGPEINIQGNGIDIPPYDNTPGVADNTDFGTVTSNNALSKTFTIQNSGNQPLNITVAETSLYNDPNQFVVTSQPATTVAPGDFTTFTVKFSPGGSGQRYSWIRILNNDCDESYYVFLVAGNAECPTLTPEINIKGNSIDIADGDDTPDATDNTDFGTTPVNTGVNKTFIIENTGVDPLIISGITFTGINAADFSVTTAPAATVAPGNSTTFTIQFLPTTGGPKIATIQINNNDCDEGNYDFILKGNDSPCIPPAAIAGSDRTACAGTSVTIGAALVPGSTYSWTSLPVGFTSTLSDPIVNPTVTTTYYITETIIETGCSNTNSVTITVNPLPAIPTVILILPTCDITTGTITVTAPTGMVSYTVTGTSPVTTPVTQAGLIFTLLTPGIYDVTAINADGCISTALTVTIKLDKAYWAGTIDDDWNTPANWNTGQVPTASTHVFIPTGTPPCRVRSADAHAASVQTQPGTTLEVMNDWKIIIHGTCASLPLN